MPLEGETLAPVADALLWIIRAELKRATASQLAAEWLAEEDEGSDAFIPVLAAAVSDGAMLPPEARMKLDAVCEAAEYAHKLLTGDTHRTPVDAHLRALDQLDTARQLLRRITDEGWDD